MADTKNIIEQNEVYVFPASYGQRRMWFLDQFEPGSPYYNIPMALRLKGPLDLSILERTVDEIVQRHESLRTTFTAIDGDPFQVIAPVFELPLHEIDLKAFPREQVENEINRLAREEARKPFDLAAGPLIRISVLRVSPDDHVILLTMHHIISDGWSMGLLAGEITTIYSAFQEGKACPLPELPFQYADFSEWQKEFFKGEIFDKQLSYWKNQLDGNPPLLELPTDRPRPAVWTNEGATISRTIPKDLLLKLNELSRREGATIFMALLAAFDVLLYRYSGQEDVSVGSPIANRNRSEIENIIGLFINTLVLRTSLAGNPGFREILRRVKTTTLGAYENQDLPFELLVEALQPDRNMSYPPLFQVMLILQNAPMSGRPIKNLSMSTIDVDMGTATFDLTFLMAEGPHGLEVSAEYNTDLFDESTIQRMLSHFENLLQSIVTHPDQPAGLLRMLRRDEKQRILADWNHRPLEIPKDTCIHHLFEKQVEQTPEAYAVVCERQRLTYNELNQTANQIARVIRKMGGGPEVPVAICMEKSVHLMAAVLGVLKAGGAYLPLDPSYPEERLQYMLEDAGVSLLITQNSLKSILPPYNRQLILLDQDWDVFEKESSENPGYAIHQNNLAYVIYTSGSTGKSKGTMVSHLSLVNAYFAWEEAYELRTRSRSHLQMASFSFDVFSGDWTRALCSGGKLVLAPRDMLLQGDELYALMKAEDVNIAEFVPAVLRNLIQHLGKTGEKLEFFRTLIAGSDIWYVSEYKKFKRYCGPDTRLINSFGLTEATIDSSYFEAQELDLQDDRLVPIGRPFANMPLYILDKNLQPVPVGVRGELFVSGKGVARGYLNRPDLTADRFIPDPFSREKGQRMYRTGDLARYLDDGNIEFLGRSDQQIKLRGFRIELGEIETALNQHDAIKDVAVVAREDIPGDKRLAAYLVATDGKVPRQNELREFLLKDLPDYMVPSAFVFLEKLPLTPNGKVDRRALPAPDQEQLLKQIEEAFVAPRTHTEEVLAGIWAEVLHLEKVGITSNFFELGGHSLLATQLISRVKRAFQTEVPLRSVFENPTVAGLAQVVEKAQLKAAGLEAPPIKPVSRREPLPLSFAQQRLWFLDQLEPESPFYNIPESYRLSGELNIAALEASFNEVVRRHENLRTAFLTEQGSPVQVISPEIKITLPLIDLSHLSEPEREEAALQFVMKETHRPIALSKAPLFRASLLKLGEDEHVIVVTIHHIISDDWSSKVFVQEIAAIYNAFCQGTSSPLPELPIQYADFAYWQRQWLQGEILQAQLDYWKEQLAGLPPLLTLPTDRPRPAVQTFNGSYQTFEISPELARFINDFNRENSVTLFMTLLAAFQILLAKYSGQNDISVGIPIANRNREEIEGLIGFFVNTLVLRTRFSGEPTFRELVMQVNEIALGAYAHQDLPFEMIVDAVQPERNLSHSPLFQVMFALQNTPVRSQELPSGLTLSPLEAHSGTAKFDLTLFMFGEGEALGGALEYNTDLFDGDTIERMVGHFRTLLKEVTGNPDRRLSEVPLMTAGEQEALLFEYNRSEEIAQIDGFVHQYFEKTCQSCAARVAAALGEEQWTFADLNKKANQLAHFLRKQGVGPDVLVGVSLERSFELLVALLGVLKAGGAYLPLDPNYPPERLSYILRDSEISVLLTQQRLREKLPIGGQRVFCLDADWAEIDGENHENPHISLEAFNLAYVIYTSGSTGKPKGTLITHGGLRNYLSWCLHAYPLGEGRGSIVHSTVAFDATVTAIFPALLAGKPLLLLPESSDIGALGAALESHGDFSLIKITPAHLEILSQQLSPGTAPSLTRALVIGGENLTSRQIEFWHKNSPDTLLFNEYGPTETVVGCVVYEASRWNGQGSVPIGRVIPGASIYVLDSRLHAVPAGVAGELYIGGAGVARGYLNRPDLTAEKFVPDPFTETPGARLYRSGDLVRLLKDGSLEFLGRLDGQVKIRGYRIEPGEIESVLTQYPGLTEAAVIVYSGGSGERRLVAYCVPEKELTIDVSSLRGFLSQKLPDYMIPSAFVMLEELPLTPNGKVDRRALPAPERAGMDVKNEFVAPETLIQEKLARIWKEVLGIEKVGIRDNFFELGGDSILSIQIIARANQAGFALTAKDIFQHPTIEGLASLEGKSRNVYAEQGPVSGLVPLTPIQRWFFEQNLEEAHHYNQSVFLEIMQPLDPEILKSVTGHLLTHHDALRLRFRKGDSGWEQNHADLNEPVPFEYFDFSDSSLPEIKDKIEKATWTIQAGLDFTDGPIFRIAYFYLGPDKSQRLLIAIHHLVVDAVSWRVLLEDFQTAYQQASEGKQISLPMKTTSFRYWAERINEYAKSAELAAEKEFWLNQLSQDVLHIPKDLPEDINTEASARSITVALNEEETRVLLQKIPAIYHTEINDLLLSALLKTVTDRCNGTNLLIDLESHGREEISDDIDVSRTVGWFTNLYPVLLARESDQMEEIILSVKDQLKNIPGRGIGYGVLLHLSEDRAFQEQIKKLPRAEIIFNYLGQFEGGAQENTSLRTAPEPAGPERSPRGIRSHLIEINGAVGQGRLEMEWSYSENIHSQQTIRDMADQFIGELRSLIIHCEKMGPDILQETNLSEFGWNKEDLDDIISTIENSDE